MTRDELKTKTKEFAESIISLCRKLPKNMEGKLLGNQIFRSGTSIAANYRSDCRAKSPADFIAKLAIVEEEADETLFWLELIQEMNIIKDSLLLDSLMKENEEIIATIVASIKTLKGKK